MSENTTSGNESVAESTGFDEFKLEATKFFRLFGNALTMTVQEVTDRVWLRLDRETRCRLDQLVASGAAENRHEALAFLVAEGVKANEAIFDRIENIRSETTSLQTQLRVAESE
jgi:hypothetical protein